LAPYQEWYKPRLNSSSDCLFINTEIFNFGVFGVVLNSAHQTHTHHRSKFHAAKHRLRTQNITSNFSEALSILPEDGSQGIRNMSEFLIVF